METNMKNTIVRSTLLIGTVAAFTIAAGCAFNVDGSVQEKSTTYEGTGWRVFSAHETLRAESLLVKGHSGPDASATIAVSGYLRPQQKQQVLADVHLSFFDDGQKLGLGAGYTGPASELVRVEQLTISLPAATEVDIEESGMDIAVTGMTGPVSVKVNGGNLDLDSLGTIRAVADGNVAAKTLVDLTATVGGNLVAEAGGGNIASEGNTSATWLGRSDLMITAGGNLSVTVPAGLGFTLDAEAGGNLSVDGGAARDGTQQRYEGAIGAGGPLRLHVRASGNINVKAATAR
jgi:hypothetical protein